jgi:FkbM family methyltransferase
LFPWKTASKLLSIIARRPGKIADLCFHLSEVYQTAYKNVSYDFAINGELWLLDRLKHLTVEMIFDVGANHGEWAAAASARFPNAVIHAFEIVPNTYNYLEDTAHRTPNIRPNCSGLADHTGFVDVSVWQKNDTVSSILDLSGIRKVGRSQIQCAVHRADEYCRERGINQIDILKIDVEGAEDLVLRGFGDLWDHGNIGLVQFEYGMANIYSHHLLIDFWRDFEKRNYQIGKLMPNNVEFTDFSPLYEDFRGPNYVAVHSSRKDFLQALQRR